MVLGDAVSTLIRNVCMDFEPCFKVYHLVSVHPRSIKIGQMTTFNMIFLVTLSIAQNVILGPVRCAISEWPILFRGCISGV